MTIMAASNTANVMDNNWARDLGHAAESLSKTAQDIQKSFQRIQNEKGYEQSDSSSGIERNLPDPVALVRRLAFLESAINELGTDCSKITEQKRDFVVSLLALQVENVQLLREIAEVMGEKEVPNADVDSESWDALASTVEEQYDLFSGQVDDE